MKQSTLTVSNAQVFRRIWDGVRPYKWLLFGSFILITAELIIVNIIPIYYKDFFDILSHSNERGTVVANLIHIISIIAILHVVTLICARLSQVCHNNMQSYTMARLRQRTFDYTIQHSHTFFANTFAGSLVQKINRFARAFEQLSDIAIYNIWPVVISVLGAVIVTWFVAPLISGVILVWVLFYTIFAICYYRWRRQYSDAVTAAESHASAVLADNIGNQNAITLFTTYAQESKNYSSVTNEHARLQRKSWNIAEIVNATYNALVYIVEFFVFYYAIFAWQNGTFTVGTFVLIQVYVIGLAQELRGINRAIRGLSSAMADAKEMIEILDTPHEIVDSPQATKLTVPQGTINFNAVTFSFNQTREVISSLNLEIKAGEKVALVGHSGAGKTTLIRLLLRLYDLTAGSITIDGQNIAHVTQESLHKNISLVPQEPVLFHRSLMENIRYGRENATDAEVIEAAKLAHCDIFIDALPLKYDTLVGERGIKLSGGERQRIAIARAILKKAPILILDEATSSLDSQSEGLIQDAFDTLMKNCTTIVIAHRLSTIRKMDRIIGLENGAVIEQGTHEELSSKENGLYANLWKLQVSGFIAE